jgi:hypothetical protein
MKAADQQLRALAKRLGAEYTPGIVEWRTFATPNTLATSVDMTPSPWWGFGPVVRKVVDANTIEVTYGVEPLIPDGSRSSPTMRFTGRPTLAATARHQSVRAVAAG